MNEEVPWSRLLRRTCGNCFLGLKPLARGGGASQTQCDYHPSAPEDSGSLHRGEPWIGVGEESSG